MRSGRSPVGPPRPPHPRGQAGHAERGQCRSRRAVIEPIGRLTAPVQINAAETMAQSRNAVRDNLSGLPLGTFNAAAEEPYFSKIQVPICLSHHAGPLQRTRSLSAPTAAPDPVARSAS